MERRLTENHLVVAAYYAVEAAKREAEAREAAAGATETREKEAA